MAGSASYRKQPWCFMTEMTGIYFSMTPSGSISTEGNSFFPRLNHADISYLAAVARTGMNFSKQYH
jgi:hypothetical protein